ncbi:mCG1050945 [Mus musculus]|nr:mCG1050945 [Mus musculus]
MPRPALPATAYLQLPKSVQKLLAGAELHAVVLTSRCPQLSGASGRLVHDLGSQALGMRPGRLLPGRPGTGKERRQEEGDKTL